MKRLLINLFTIVIAMVVIEIISRVVLAKIYNRDFDSSLIVDNKYFDSPGLKPNAKGKVWGKDFNTDEYGGRKLPKSDRSQKKILYIGDSVAEGVGVEDSATFLAISNPGLGNAINLSFIGYSTHDYVNTIKYHLAADTNISMVSMYYCLNDVYGASKTKDLPVMAKQNITGTVNGLLQNSYATYKLIKLFVYQNSSSYFKYDLQFYNPANPHFEQAMRDVKQCDSICRANGVAFFVYTLPYRSQLMGKYKGNYTPQKMVYDYCSKNDIICMDFTPALAEVENPKELYLFADEIHFSESGHRALAKIWALWSAWPVI